MPEKSLKQRIRDGELIKALGVSTDIERASLEDYLAQGEYDFISVDCQHAAFNEERLVAFCAIAQDLSIPVRIRIKHTQHAYLIGTYLDLGPSGIMIPEVASEDIVDQGIASFYYPQKGKRSWGGTARVGLSDRSDRLEYAAWWNDYGTLTLQIESVEAVIHARQLAKPGVDVLAFGLNDLMFSIEAHSQFPIRTYEDCIRHVLDQLDGTGVRIGLRAESDEERERYLDMGVTVLLERTDI